MTSLYNGWTVPEVMNPAITRANQALGRVMDALGDANAYPEWYAKNITSGMSYGEIANVAEAWLAGDDCCHCNDGMCKCTYHSEDIPY